MKVQKIKKMRCTFLFSILFLLFVIALLVFIAYANLIEIGRKERLRKLDHYENYLLTYEKMEQCSMREVFVVNHAHFFYDCLDTVDLYYGSTRASLQEMMDLGYLNIASFVENLDKISEEDGVTKYKQESTRERQGFLVEVRKTEERTDFILSPL